MTLIDPTALHSVFMQCLAPSTDHEGVVVEGVLHSFMLDPAQLEYHRDEVRTWLLALPEGFRRSAGGGWSFLRACMDRDDHQWGEHRNVEELLVLGIGLKLATMLFPRAVWDALPGGMPYFRVEDES